ncbi:hypothetical protein ADK64_32785 [Streptomyces sp. MMG1121]|nr:hypothetical protein ADK64_32785 [Streptomyces sp. MMG1121]
MSRPGLTPNRSGGDPAIQACADGPPVAFHAIRDPSRIGRDTVVTTWPQLGFGKAAPDGSDQPCMRGGSYLVARRIEGCDHDYLILRRGYTSTDGIVASSGELDAALFFIAYRKDPRGSSSRSSANSA